MAATQATTTGPRIPYRKKTGWYRFVHNDLVAYLFLLPFIIPFFFVVVLPAISGIAISFFRWSITGTPQWVGLNNYLTVLKQPLFQGAVVNTLKFMAYLVPIPIIVGLALALLLNQPMKGRSIARSLITAPRVLMVSAVGIIWGWMFNGAFGLLNYYLLKLGIKPVPWLTDPGWAVFSIAFTTLWWTVNGNLIIYLAGLQDIPQELYEAAKIDGANAWHLFRHITLPSLSTLNTFIIPMSFIAASRIFGQIYTMTGGGPVGKTFVIVFYIYTEAFQNFHMGLAAAAAVLLTVVSIAITLVQLRAMKGLD